MTQQTHSSEDGFLWDVMSGEVVQVIDRLVFIVYYMLRSSRSENAALSGFHRGSS